LGSSAGFSVHRITFFCRLVITRRLIFSEDKIVLVSGRHLSSILSEFKIKKEKKKNEKKTSSTYGIELRIARNLGNRSNQSTNLPLRINLCSLLYLNRCLLITVRSTKQAGVFQEKCVRTAAKTMVVDRKNQKALALLYLRSGPLRNTAKSSVEPTEFAAEPTTKMKSSKVNLVTWSFCLPPKRQLSILLNFFFPFIDIWYFFSSSKPQVCRTE